MNRDSNNGLWITIYNETLHQWLRPKALAQIQSHTNTQKVTDC